MTSSCVGDGRFSESIVGDMSFGSLLRLTTCLFTVSFFSTLLTKISASNDGIYKYSLLPSLVLLDIFYFSYCTSFIGMSFICSWYVAASNACCAPLLQQLCL